MSINPITVVGGGPVGLMCALYLRRVKNRPVVVIEQQPAAGGLYASQETPFGWVDQGVHIPQLTGVPEIDELFFDAIPRNEWQILSGVHKDIAGNLFCGRLDAGSLYPDLRQLPPADYQMCVGDIFTNVNIAAPGLSNASNLQELFSGRFGPKCTVRVLEPIARKIWGQPLEKMNPCAAKLVHLARLVTHGPEVTALLKQSPILDAVIGYPDQMLAAPTAFANIQPALYPVQFGLHNLVAGWMRRLSELGVTVMTSSEVCEMVVEGSHIRSLKLSSDGKPLEVETSDVIWTSPLPPLQRLLNLPTAPLPDAPIPHRVVHLFLDRPPSTGPLYWLWCYDEGDSLIRVSSPHAYCPDSVRDGVYQICAELHVPTAATSDEDAVKLTEDQLRMRCIIAQGTSVVGHHVLTGIRMFHVPTVGNCEYTLLQRQSVQEVQPANLILAAQDLSAGIFYMPDILRQAVTQFKNL